MSASSRTMLGATILCLASAALAAGACAEVPPERRCNGSAALCQRPYDEVVLAGAHNAMSAAVSGFSVPNQRLNVDEQLAAGIRAFLLDTYETDQGLLLCHGPCTLGSLPLIDALGIFRNFLDAHPDDLIELLLEDHAPTAGFAAAVTEAGLADRVITHEPESPWPTLGELLSSGAPAGGQIFVTVENSGPPPEWIQPMWAHYADTPFQFETVEQMGCALNRGSDTNALFLVNHWLGNPFPDEALAAQANDIEVLRARVGRCEQERGRLPHVLAVDFVDEGGVFELVNELNGIDHRVDQPE